MKQVLLIDVAPSLKSYIVSKLKSKDMKAVCIDGVDNGLKIMAQTKIDLIIIDYCISRNVLFDFLAKKQAAPKISGIPIIALVRDVNKKDVSLLVSYNVKKVFSKPIKVDEFVTSIGAILDTPFEFDRTPCMLDVRVNEDIIFIELAQGLNRDKIELLQYRISELAELYTLASAKILIMMSDLNITCADAAKLEYLIATILRIPIVKPENIKVLTLNGFILQFFKEHPDYKTIEVASSFESALSQLIAEPAAKSSGIMETRFKLDTGEKLSIAAVDDDVVVRQIMHSIFSDAGANIAVFENGADFLKSFKDNLYDLVFLDIMMPEMSGMDVLLSLNAAKAHTPVVVLSSVTERKSVFKALEKGVKRYLIKPINPEVILLKTQEILGVNI